MALEQDTISIDLAQGINNKVDDKIAGAEQTSVLVDARFDKDKRLIKRNGLTAQSMNFQGDPGFINSVSFSSGDLKSIGFVHQDQLCVANNGNLFSQYTGQDKWIFKGTYVPLNINISRLDANVKFTYVVTSSGVTVAASAQDLYVAEEATGSIIRTYASGSTESVVGLLGFQSSVYALTSGSSPVTPLYARSIDLSTGSVGNRITIVSDFIGSTFPPPLSAITSSASHIGEAALILYSTSSAMGSQSKIIPFNASGTVSSSSSLTLGSITAIYNGITIAPATDPNVFYVVGQSVAQAWNIGSTNYSNKWSTGYTYTTSSTAIFVNQTHAFTMAVSPINNQDLFIYYDNYAGPPTASSVTSIASSVNYSDDNIITAVQINSGGAVISNYIYGYGYYIAGQCFPDPKRKTIYLPVFYQSPLQKTILLTDTLEGRVGFDYFVGKTLYGEADAVINPLTPGISFPISQTLPTSSGGDVYRMTNNGYFIDFDLSPTNAAETQFLANTTHLTGGFLWSYDGQTIAEHNFLISPEHSEINPGPRAVVANIVTVGSASVGEEFFWTYKGGNSNMQGVGSTSYLAFNSIAAGNFYIWYRVNGVGNDPTPAGRNGIPVNILSSDTGAEIAYKTKLAIAQVGNVGYLVTWPSSQNPSDQNTLGFSSTLGGAVTAPTVNDMLTPGELRTGSYLYSFVWSWFDKNGNNYRSAPSVPRLVSATGSNSAVINLWAPQLTNKPIQNVVAEIYRSQVNDTVLNFAGSTSWTQSAPRVTYLDSASDAIIADKRELYTTGGVLDNYNISACKSVNSFKERLQVTGVDNPYAIYYSKNVVSGEPVNFSAELFYNVDSDLTPVTTVVQMDDKSCVFKPNLIYVLSGDGANDLGEGSTFSPPLLVASDAGTSIPNSVVLYKNGLLFKSSKGIYNLDRSLGVNYSGYQVEDYNSFNLSAAVLMKNQTEIRFVNADTSSGLIYNYFFDRWDVFSNYQADDATIYNGNVVLVRNSGQVYVENQVHYDINTSSVSYSMSLETPWLKLKGIQDFQRVYSLEILGEYKTPHTLNINVSYDYDVLTANAQTYVFDATSIIGNASTFPGAQVYQFGINLERQKCESIKIKIAEVAATGSQAGTQASLYLNNLSADVGLKKGQYKLPANKQA